MLVVISSLMFEIQVTFFPFVTALSRALRHQDTVTF